MNLLGCLTGFQLLCAGFFISELLTEILGLIRQG